MAVFKLTVVRHGETRYNKEKMMQGQGIDMPLTETGVRQANAAGVYLSNVKFTHVFSSDLIRAKQDGIIPSAKRTFTTHTQSASSSLVAFKSQEGQESSTDVVGLIFSRILFISSGGTHSNELINMKQAGVEGVSLEFVSTTASKSEWIQTADLILKNSQFCKEIDVKYDERLRERKYGVAEGRPQSDLKAMAKASGEQCPYFTPPGAETLDEVKARAQDFFEYLCNLIAHEVCPEKQTSPRTKEKRTDVAERHSTSLSKFDGGLLFHSDSDGAAEALDANVLVVSHGGYMKTWISYFISNLNCTMPPALTRTEVISLSPNTGISQFITTLDMKKKPKIYCICLNRDEHLGGIKDENMSH